jgi:hypothetical protein
MLRVLGTPQWMYCEEFDIEYVLDVGQCISVVVFELDVSYRCCYGI